jgi:uncharacterized membrane protein YbaN (DUF454 family)
MASSQAPEPSVAREDLPVAAGADVTMAFDVAPSASPAPMEEEAAPVRVSSSPLLRGLWILLGLIACGLGGIGLVVPGMPATVFFLMAAFFFSRSSPRLLNWILSLPRVGPMVRDFRAGRGLPRRAKAAALAGMALAGGSSLWALPGLPLKATVFVLLATGASVVAWGTPTSDRDEERRQGSA